MTARADRAALVDTCSPYLMSQLESCDPRLVMAYGADVCRWFYPGYSQADAFSLKACRLVTGKSVDVVLVPQTRGSHTADVIEKVKSVIAENL